MGSREDISSFTLAHLHTDVIFGIGVMFLYILVPTALLANEVRLAKQSDDTSGATSVVNAMAQGAFFIIGWLLAVTILAFLLVGFGGHSPDSNPGQGMYDFWDVNWMSNNTMASVNFVTLAEEKQAESLVLMLSVAKLINILLLGVMLILTISLSAWVPLQKMRRTAHYQMDGEVNLGTAMVFLMVFFVGIGMFTLIINMIDFLLTAVLSYAAKSHPSGTTFNPEVTLNVLDDLWVLLKQGIDEWDYNIWDGVSNTPWN